MVEYKPASDRSSLRIERAYFTQLSSYCDNSDDVLGSWFSMNLSRIWTEGTFAWLNHSFNQRGGVSGCLICVSFVLQDPSWSIRQIDVLPFTPLRSPWLYLCPLPMWADVDHVEILPSLLPIIMISYSDARLVRDTGELMSISVYLCLHGLLDRTWWELLDSLHDNGYHDHVQGIDVDVVDLSLYFKLCTATGLLFELISVIHYCVDAGDAKSERLPSRAKLYLQSLSSLREKCNMRHCYLF